MFARKLLASFAMTVILFAAMPSEAATIRTFKSFDTTSSPAGTAPSVEFSLLIPDDGPGAFPAINATYPSGPFPSPDVFDGLLSFSFNSGTISAGLSTFKKCFEIFPLCGGSFFITISPETASVSYSSGFDSFSFGLSDGAWRGQINSDNPADRCGGSVGCRFEGRIAIAEMPVSAPASTVLILGSLLTILVLRPRTHRISA